MSGYDLSSFTMHVTVQTKNWNHEMQKSEETKNMSNDEENHVIRNNIIGLTLFC